MTTISGKRSLLVGSTSSCDVFKRSLNITSELDVSRRKDLDVRTMEEWWLKQATESHRQLVIFLTMLMSLFWIHVVASFLFLYYEDIYPNPYICESIGCKQAANNIIAKIDETVDPCDDFHLFVCGKQWEQSKAKYSNGKANNDEDWVLITDQIVFDFRRSETFGKMLRTKIGKRVNRLLRFYQACMDIRRRNALKLDPLFEIFKRYEIHSTVLQGEFPLEKRLGHIYGDELLEFALYDILLNYQSETFQLTRKKIATKAGLSFGYEITTSVMINAITYLAESGKSYSNYKTTWNLKKIPIYVKLFICAQLNLFPYFIHGLSGPKVWDGFDAKEYFRSICKWNTTSGETLPNSNGIVFTTFIWEDFLIDPTELYEIMKPTPKTGIQLINYKSLMSIWMGPNINLDNSLHVSNEKTHYADGLLHNHDLTVRFLQWLLLRENSNLLDEKMSKIFWPVTREYLECDWITTCLTLMVSYLGTPTTYFYIKALDEQQYISNHTSNLVDDFGRIIEKLSPTFTFPTLVEASTPEARKRLFKIAFNSGKLTWYTNLTHLVGKITNRISFLRLAQFEFGPDHFSNIIRVKVLHSATSKSNLIRFNNADFGPVKRERIQINRGRRTECDINTNLTYLVMPLGGLQIPHFGNNFKALDIASLGIYSMQSLMEYVTTNGMYGAIASKFKEIKNEPNTPTTCIDWSINNTNQKAVNSYDQAFAAFAVNFSKNVNNEYLWKIPGSDELYNELNKDVNNLYSNQLNRQLAMKISYDLHEEYIQKNSIQRKLVLPGLEKYNARKILFIQTANLKCEDYSKNKFIHSKNLGPVPSPISINLLAANSKEFSEVFKCQEGTKMNPKTKINLYNT